MSRKCIICKKELSDDNKGFLCQYHKDKAKEDAKKAGAAVAGAGLAVVTVGKNAYEHKDEIAAAAKKAVIVVKDIVKNNL